MKPLSSVEVVEKEEANFDTEISEDDVAGEWKLKGQVLTRSPVRFKQQILETYNRSSELPHTPYYNKIKRNQKNLERNLQIYKFRNKK